MLNSSDNYCTEVVVSALREGGANLFLCVYATFKLVCENCAFEKKSIPAFDYWF